MANDQGDEGRREFDLEERTALFGEAVIKFAKRIPINEVTRSLIGQLARETKHWLRMVVTAEPSLAAEARPIWQEAKELNLICGAIRRRKRG